MEILLTQNKTYRINNLKIEQEIEPDFVTQSYNMKYAPQTKTTILFEIDIHELSNKDELNNLFQENVYIYYFGQITLLENAYIRQMEMSAMYDILHLEIESLLSISINSLSEFDSDDIIAKRIQRIIRNKKIKRLGIVQ